MLSKIYKEIRDCPDKTTASQISIIEKNMKSTMLKIQTDWEKWVLNRREPGQWQRLRQDIQMYIKRLISYHGVVLLKNNSECLNKTEVKQRVRCDIGKAIIVYDYFLKMVYVFIFSTFLERRYLWQNIISATHHPIRRLKKCLVFACCVGQSNNSFRKARANCACRI